jgi:hypothetical protein
MIVYERGPNYNSRHMRREGTVTAIGFSRMENIPTIHLSFDRTDGKGSFQIHLTSAEIDRLVRYREEHKGYFTDEGEAA